MPGDSTISGLPAGALTGANTAVTSDLLAIDDVSAGATKNITPQELANADANLSDAGALASANTVRVVQSGVAKKSALSAIADWIIQTYASFTQYGTGAVSQSVQDKLRHRVEAEDFMTSTELADVIAGTGSVNVTAACQAAIDAVAAAGGGTVHFAYDGPYSVSGLTVPGTAQSASNVSLEGNGATVLKARTGTTIVLNCPEDIARDGARVIKKLKIDGNSISGVIGLKAYQVLHLHLEDIDIKACDVAFQLETIQETYAENCVARGLGNNIGWLIKQNPAGCTSSKFVRCSAQSSAACGWAFIGDGGAASMETIVMDSCLVQSNAPVGMYLKDVGGLLITGETHFEANARTGTTATIDGNTVDKAVIYADGSFFAMSGVRIAEAHSGNTKIISLNDSSTLILDGVVGSNGSPPNGDTFDCDSTSRMAWVGALRQGASGGYASKWPAYLTAPFQGGGYYGYGQAIRTYLPGFSNEATGADEAQTHSLDTATDSGSSVNANFGIARTIQFAASAGSSSTNRTRLTIFSADTPESNASYAGGVILQASATTTLRFSFGTQFCRDFDVPLVANVPTRVSWYVRNNTGTAATRLLIWPTDSAGAAVQFIALVNKKVSSSAARQEFDIASKIVSDGAHPNLWIAGRTYAADPILFSTDNSDDIGAASANRPRTGYFGTSVSTPAVAFPASQSASADANTLDDYEEGSGTVALTFSTPGDLSVSYSTQTYRYQKVGNRVKLTIDIATSAFTHTTASGSLRITGLPIGVGAVGNGYRGALDFQGITKANYTNFTLQAVPSTSVLNVGASGSGQSLSTVMAADMPTGGSVILRGVVIYETTN